MNLDKLKEAARRHELREEWRKAIEVYHRALAELADAGEPHDPSLFNRIGDLELKAGGVTEAIHGYEQAADTYADQGFFNNAIALCGKILRVDPARTATYLRLAELHARKNVGAEVRRNLTEYVERLGSPTQLEALVAALRRFAERFALSIEQRNLFAEVLRDAPRAPHTLAALERLAGELGLNDGAAGHAPAPTSVSGTSSALGGLVFIDTSIYPTSPRVADLVSIEEPPSPAHPAERPIALEAAAPPSVPPIEFMQPTAIEAPSWSERLVGVVLEGFEPTRVDPADLPVDVPSGLALETITPQLVEIPGLEPLPVFLAPAEDFALDPIPLGQARLPLLEVPGLSGEALFDELDVEEESWAAAAEEPTDLLAATDAELEGAVAQSTAKERWDVALPALAELLRRYPDAIPQHQRRVQIAYRSGDRHQLIGAYLSLAQGLERAGARENAAMVYERVREHDPGNPVAEAALVNLRSAASTPKPEDPVPAASGGYVDLGALIRDPEPEKDTRMRVDQGEPESEKDVDFRETLEQFKQGIAANIDAEDFQAHYDLGIAFKEMGLLDEAIAQFQKALRSPEGRLKSSEALGITFFEQQRFATAEAVLLRAIESLAGADDEKIGLIYWLGRTLEGQGKPGESLRWYERALAVDITFLDLSHRIQRLTTEKVP